MKTVTERELGSKVEDGLWEVEYRNDRFVQVLIWKGARATTATFKVAA